MMGQAVHLPNLTANERCQVVALSDIREKVGRKVAERHRIPAFYASFDDMLAKESLDAVAMILPFHDNAALVTRALKAAKPVYIEKPMALNLADAQRMAEAAKAHGTRIMVAYHKRYDPGVEKAKALVDGFRASGELGKLISARVWNNHGDWIAGFPRQTIEEPSDPKTPGPKPGSFGVPEWLNQSLRPTYYGTVGNLCHDVNLMRYLLGDPRQVDCAVIRQGMIYNPPAAVLFDYGDFEAILETGMINTEVWDEGVRANFEKGWVELRVVPPLLRAPSEVTIRRQAKGTERIAVEFGWAFGREVVHFIECVATGRDFRSSGDDGAKDLAVLEAMFRSAQERQPMSL
jgi:predicted dehydrogenase